MTSLWKSLPWGPVLFLMDYDGTLREFVSRPGSAGLSRERRALLARLNARRGPVAIVTGRPVREIKRLVGVPDLIYCGNFGLEIEGPAWSFRHARASRAQGALRALAGAIATLGARVENKGLGLAVHDEEVSPNGRRPFRLMRQQSRASGVRWLRGRRVWEALPDVGWGKRQAAMLVWRRAGRPAMIAIGDSAADEELFGGARGRGTSICVGRKSRSSADFRLKDVAQVYRFLEAMEGGTHEHSMADRIVDDSAAARDLRNGRAAVQDQRALRPHHPEAFRAGRARSAVGQGGDRGRIPIRA